MGSKELPPEPSKPSAKAAERLAVIVDAAERAALGVIDDAEKEAQRYLEEAKARADRIAAERLRETADELERKGGAPSPMPAPGSRPEPDAFSEPEPIELRHAPEPPSAAPGREAEEAAADGEALREADDDRNLTPSEEASRPAERLKVAPVPEAAVDSAPADADRNLTFSKEAGASAKPSSAAARLLATQMAVSGASRKEIEMRLRNGFEIDDTAEILDAILGPEG